MVSTAASTNEIENIEADELNKCLAKFYVSVSKTDGSYCKKTSLLLIRHTLDRHLNGSAKQQEIQHL